MGARKKSTTCHSGTVHDVDLRIAEIYDRTETSADDIALIQTLIDGPGALKIPEPFCGTGRILLPLCIAGHDVVGLDWSAAMLNRAKSKPEDFLAEVQQRVTLIEADVTCHRWPTGFDLVILGGNCLYELATPQEQSGRIASAADAVDPGGYVYIDNDHMEGKLDASWRQPGVREGFPSGMCSDGTRVEGRIETT